MHFVIDFPSITVGRLRSETGDIIASDSATRVLQKRLRLDIMAALKRREDKKKAKVAEAVRELIKRKES